MLMLKKIGMYDKEKMIFFFNFSFAVIIYNNEKKAAFFFKHCLLIEVLKKQWKPIRIFQVKGIKINK